MICELIQCILRSIFLSLLVMGFFVLLIFLVIIRLEFGRSISSGFDQLATFFYYAPWNGLLERMGYIFPVHTSSGIDALTALVVGCWVQKHKEVNHVLWVDFIYYFVLAATHQVEDLELMSNEEELGDLKDIRGDLHRRWVQPA